MKIATVVGTFFPNPGGAQVQAHNACNKLIEKNIEVDCYLFNKTNIKNNNYKIVLFNKLITSLVFFFRFYLNINLNFLLKKYLKTIIKKEEYDFWHFIFLNHKCLILIECLSELDQKTIITFQGVDLQIDREINYGYRLDKKYEKFLKLIIKKVNYFFYISKTIKNDLLKLYVPEKKMIYSPNSVEISKFKKYLKFKKKQRKLRFITVARYSIKKKGYDKLEYISKNLIDVNIDFEWKVVGKDILKLSSEKFFQENSRFFKFYEDIENVEETYFPHSSLIKLLIDSDIYLNLSRIESFGITYIEALASLTPILSFNSKGANEIIINNLNGFLVNDESEFINKIKDISENKEIIYNLENNLLETIKNYDLNLVIDKYDIISNKLKQKSS
jgi:glycosyltransferase involved in cell wall biosynthesis